MHMYTLKASQEISQNRRIFIDTMCYMQCVAWHLRKDPVDLCSQPKSSINACKYAMCTCHKITGSCKMFLENRIRR